MGASLGFHAPFIKDVPQQIYSALDLETAYRQSIAAIRDLARLGRDRKTTILPQPVFNEMLAKGPNELS
jgi:hypothetical protein